MPARTPAIQTHDLLSKLDELPDIIPLIPAQVSLLTGLSADALKERRRPPAKPPIALPPLDGKTGAFAWYTLGEVRRFFRIRSGDLSAQTEPPVLGFATFEKFIGEAGLQDRWPFALLEDQKRPVDLVEHMLSGMSLSEDDACQWMTLNDYLVLRMQWGEIKQSEAWSEEAAQQLPLGLIGPDITRI